MMRRCVDELFQYSYRHDAHIGRHETDIKDLKTSLRTSEFPGSSMCTSLTSLRKRVNRLENTKHTHVEFLAIREILNRHSDEIERLEKGAGINSRLTMGAYQDQAHTTLSCPDHIPPDLYVEALPTR